MLGVTVKTFSPTRQSVGHKKRRIEPVDLTASERSSSKVLIGAGKGLNQDLPRSSVADLAALFNGIAIGNDSSATKAMDPSSTPAVGHKGDAVVDPASTPEAFYTPSSTILPHSSSSSSPFFTPNAIDEPRLLPIVANNAKDWHGSPPLSPCAAFELHSKLTPPPMAEIPPPLTSILTDDDTDAEEDEAFTYIPFASNRTLQFILTKFKHEIQFTTDKLLFLEPTLLLRAMISGYQVAVLYAIDVLGKHRDMDSGSFSAESQCILLGGLAQSLFANIQHDRVGNVRDELHDMLLTYYFDSLAGRPPATVLFTPFFFFDDLSRTCAPTLACTGCMQPNVAPGHCCVCKYGTLIFRPYKKDADHSNEDLLYDQCPFCPKRCACSQEMAEHWHVSCRGFAQLNPKPTVLTCLEVLVVVPFWTLGAMAPQFCRKCHSLVPPDDLDAHAVVCSVDTANPVG